MQNVTYSNGTVVSGAVIRSMVASRGRARTRLASLALAACLALGLSSPRAFAQDTVALSTTVRTALGTAIITAAGASAKIKLYNGTRPASGGTATGTLLATLNMGSVIGTCTSGVITLDATGMTQSNGSHVAGAPTWLRLTTSGDVFVADFSITADATFSGTVVTGTNITLNASTITMPNA